MKKISYKTSGVNIKKADEFVKNIRLGKSPINKTAAFGSLFSLVPMLKKIKEPVLVSSTDGVGTKLLIAQKLKIHDTVGIDLVAMNVNDIVCLGARPLFFLDYIACGKVDPKVLGSVVKGINNGLAESDCALLGGETAEMPGMYKKDEYDLAGFCVGIADKNRLIDGKRIAEGDIVIGIESSGLHSNGFSLARAAIGERNFRKYSKELLEPTRIYVKPVLSMIEVFDSKIKGIAHVTGGAFYTKATKILPKGLGMFIDKKSWRVPEIFQTIQSRGSIAEREMYSVFNMGIGMAVVVERKSANKVLDHLNKFHNTYIIGKVIKGKKKMVLF